MKERKEDGRSKKEQEEVWRNHKEKHRREVTCIVMYAPAPHPHISTTQTHTPNLTIKMPSTLKQTHPRDGINALIPQTRDHTPRYTRYTPVHPYGTSYNYHMHTLTANLRVVRDLSGS